MPSWASRRSATYSQVRRACRPGDSPATPWPSRSSANAHLALDGLGQHLADLAERARRRTGRAPRARTVSTTSKAKAMCMRLVAEHPVGARRQAVEQARGAQEVDVGEGAEEEQALDAGGEADQVEQERAPVGGGLAARRSSPIESIHRKQNSALRLIDGMFSIAANASRALGVVGQVGVEQGQVELDVHGLLEQLPGQVQPGLGRVDVLVEVEHQVVGDDRVAGGEERHQPVDQVPLGRREPLAGRPGRRAGRPPRRSRCS